jgi:hypothetical protein
MANKAATPETSQVEPTKQQINEQATLLIE